MIAFKTLKQFAKNLKSELLALYYASRDPRTPMLAKLLTICVVAYAFSPIDLIPDFIPVLGFLDDLVLLPLGIAFVIKLIPEAVLQDSRERARLDGEERKPANWIAGLVIIFIWIALVIWLGKWIFPRLADFRT